MDNYKLFGKVTATASKKLITQTLWIGAGIKTASGEFDVNVNLPDLAALSNTQTGSSCTDFLLNANYIISINRLGISTYLLYKINNINRYNYFFGNKVAAGSITYNTYSSKKINLTPNAGILYTQNQSNTFKQQKITDK